MAIPPEVCFLPLIDKFYPFIILQHGRFIINIISVNGRMDGCSPAYGAAGCFL